MPLEINNEWPEKLLRGWAKAYRDNPEYRFPSDPSAEFFPVDMEAAANEIERLRAIEVAARVLGQFDCGGRSGWKTPISGTILLTWLREIDQRPI